VVGELPWHRLTQVPEQMPAIGHLNRLWGAHRGSLGELPGAIPADHLDLGLGL
jgi:hypothetical protein